MEKHIPHKINHKKFVSPVFKIFHTLSSIAFSIMASVTFKRSPNSKPSSVVPRGRPRRRKRSSQWSGERWSPLTYFRSGIIIYRKNAHVNPSSHYGNCISDYGGTRYSNKNKI